MKRMIAFILTAALLLPLLTACSHPITPSPQMLNPAELYFRRTEVQHGSEDGVLCAQTVDLGQTVPELDAFLELYLKTPPAEGLESPFPKQLQILAASVSNDTVTLQLGGAYAELSGIQATIADACLAKTVLPYAGAEKLLLTVSDSAGQTVRTKKLSESDLLLFDDSSDTSSTSYILYFTDEHARYLIPERRTVPYIPAADLPKQLVAQLIAGPETNGLQKTLPDGTRLLDINVDSGICAVDFSADFLNNRPQTVAEERMALLSVANTLTALDTIEQVQFYVEGRRQELFCFLSLSDTFVSDAAAIGPARTDLNELDATVYLPVEGSGLLYAVPARLKTGNETAAETVLRFLSDYEPKNGLADPLFGRPLPDSIRTEKNCCILDYPADTVFGDDTGSELAAIRMLTASLTALDGIESIRLLVGGEPVQLRFNTLPEELTPSAGWYCETE